ncbi:MAG: leucine-rich repeat domain-containing protein [Clostridia bacterium]|nr:leucine-rich repeat domain-containing protein [Clostridia bacterium]
MSMINDTKGSEELSTTQSESVSDIIKRIDELEEELIAIIKEKTTALKKQIVKNSTVLPSLTLAEEENIFDVMKVSKGVVILGLIDKQKKIDNLVIPEKIGNDKVISIEDNAFANKASIKRVELPACLEVIGEKSFYNCTGLKHVLIPKSVRKIGWAAFDAISSEARIYCEVEKRPQGWKSDWYAWESERVRWGM